nr:hypothetical protein [uncultured bacterium]
MKHRRHPPMISTIRRVILRTIPIFPAWMILLIRGGRLALKRPSRCLTACNRLKPFAKLHRSRTFWSMPPWPASKQRPDLQIPSPLFQPLHPRPASVLGAGSISGCPICLVWPQVCCLPRRSCWLSGGGPSCTAAMNCVVPTSEPSVPPSNRSPAITVERCLRRIGMLSLRWPRFVSLLTTAIAPTKGSIAHAAEEKRRAFPSIPCRLARVGSEWIDSIRGGPSWVTPILFKWPTCWVSQPLVP